jgi:hypothetical protein
MLTNIGSGLKNHSSHFGLPIKTSDSVWQTSQTAGNRCFTSDCLWPVTEARTPKHSAEILCDPVFYTGQPALFPMSMQFIVPHW